jgi:ATPase subunit of ABC transporter with duplicated ATPase domains
MPTPTFSSMPSALLSAVGLHREHGVHTVLNDVSMTIGPGDRIGIVGPNGVGKSTLLRILAGIERPHAGRVDCSPPNATIGYFAQERDRRVDESVADYLRRRTGVTEAEAGLLAAADVLAAGDVDASSQYADALDHWDRLGAADFGSRMEAVVEELSDDRDLLEAAMDSLSGGQGARVDLASVLLSRFDITLLDEPTNDLDFAGLSWLEHFVTEQTGGIVVVSHDRAFLERTVTSVLELDEHSHRAMLFRGGWLAYLDEKATVRRHAEEDYAVYEDRRQTLDHRATRERQWATTGVSKEKRSPRDSDKMQRDFRVNRTEHLAARARRTERAAERLEIVDKPWESWELRFSIARAPRSGSLVATLDQAVVQRGAFRLGPIDLVVAWGDRLAITGPNGSGKSTLIEVLLGRLSIVAGRRSLGSSVVVGELGQHRQALIDGPNLLAAFLRRTALPMAEARGLLAKFGLGVDEVARPVNTLSPGERTRAELAGFQATGVNLLVLDEPTNHLDVPAIEQLEAALDAYDGTLLVVTHDRRLLANLRVTGELDVAALPVTRTPTESGST